MIGWKKEDRMEKRRYDGEEKIGWRRDDMMKKRR